MTNNKFEQLEMVFMEQQQAAEEMAMIEEQLDNGAEIEEAFIEEIEDNEAAADKKLVEAAAAHMTKEGREALLFVHKHQPTEAIKKAIEYAQAVTGLEMMSHN